jgi:hypothetical protein
MGCCGNKKANSEYEVTFRDGTKKRFATVGEARTAARLDTTEGARSPLVRAVAKIA